MEKQEYQISYRQRKAEDEFNRGTIRASIYTIVAFSGLVLLYSCSSPRDTYKTPVENQRTVNSLEGRMR